VANTDVWGRLLALVIVVATGLPAGVARGDDPHTPAVVYTGLPASPDAAGRIASLMALLDPPVPLDSPPVHLATLLAQAELTAFGAPGATCDEERRDAGAYQRELDELYRATLMADDVDPLIRRAVDMQACLVEPVDPRALARADFVEAVLAFAEGDEQRAREAFTRVFAIDPHHPWDDEFPPDAQILFAQVATDVVRTRHAPVRVLAAPGDEVWIDGLKAGSGGASVELAAGRHLVQVIGAVGGPTLAISLVTREGEPAAVVAPAVSERGDLTETEAAALASALAGGQDGGTVHLVAVADPALWVWRVTPDSPHPVALATPPVARSVVAGLVGLSVERIRSRRVAAGVLLGAGAGLTVAGALIAGIAGDEARTLHDGVESGELGPFPCEGHPDPGSFELYNTWKSAGDRARLGVGLLAAGGTMMVVAIPVGAVGAGRRHTVSLGGYLVPDPRGWAAASPADGRGVMPLLGGVRIRIEGRGVRP